MNVKVKSFRSLYVGRGRDLLASSIREAQVLLLQKPRAF